MPMTPSLAVYLPFPACGSARQHPIPRSGLNTLLVEREDWAAGTSSRSTKLVHGGVRYLEKARPVLAPSSLL